ncbi:MAG: Lrp/AsnC family transcriptional regulator [Thermoprotei archaeon]|nr:Lrp/AsnC family transcriptional regulator [TACK group archaeon]
MTAKPEEGHGEKVAYVLIKTKVGKEKEVLSQLKRAGCVGEASLLLGGYYDILMKVSYRTQKDLKDTVAYSIRGNDDVVSTLTMISLD